MIKPFMRYVGGKTRMAKMLVEELPSNIKEYREPMVGGGGMLLYTLQNIKKPDKVIVGDADKSISDIWENVVYKNEELREEIDTIIKRYLDTGIDDITSIGKIGIEESAMKIVENHLTDLGNYGKRETSNTRIGLKLEKIRYDLGYKIKGAGEIIKNIEVRNESYEWSLREYDKDCVVFLDPPYVEVQDKRGYYKGHKQFDFDMLYNELINTNNRFIMTIDDASFVDRFIDKFNVKRVEVYYPMGGKKKVECIIKNY